MDFPRHSSFRIIIGSIRYILSNGVTLTLPWKTGKTNIRGCTNVLNIFHIIPVHNNNFIYVRKRIITGSIIYILKQWCRIDYVLEAFRKNCHIAEDVLKLPKKKVILSADILELSRKKVTLSEDVLKLLRKKSYQRMYWNYPGKSHIIRGCTGMTQDNVILSEDVLEWPKEKSYYQRMYWNDPRKSHYQRMY